MANSDAQIDIFDLANNAQKQRWDDQQTARQASFLQSASWGQFQQSFGAKAHLLAGDGWSCLAIQRRTALGQYLFAPYGPTIDRAEAADDALASLKNYGNQLGVNWLRLEPLLSGSDSPLPGSPLKKVGGRLAPHNIEPAMTRILDLRPDADELLAQISRRTREFIRKNQRDGAISFRTSDKPADITYFVSMISSVADRKRINFFSEQYFTKQAEILMPAGMMFLELAYAQDKPIGGIIMHDYGKISSYTYAATLPEARQGNVSALLLWQAMLNAKARGMGSLDLYGVAPVDAPPSHPWYGFSAFKQKFGGRVVEHAGTWDIPLSSGRYSVYRQAYKAHRAMTRRH